MLDFFKRHFESEFIRNVLTLATGTTIAQAITISISPILTRLYTPDDFGILALFISVVAIFSSVINAKYEMAIMIPQKDNDALVLVILSVVIAITISSILFFLILLFKKDMSQFMNEPRIENWLLLVPFSILCIGIYNALNLYNTRNKKYIEVSKSSIAKSMGLVITQTSLGVANVGALGLVSGQIVSYFFGNSILIKTFDGKWGIIRSINLEQLKLLAVKFKKFPLFTLPGAVLNSITLNITNFLISLLFATKILGYYSLSTRVLGAPSAVLGSSIGKVYFQEGSRLIAEGKSLTKLFKSTILKLILISFPLFTFLYFIIEPLFAYVFGDNWIIAGTYAKILLPLIAMRFISSTMSNTLHILERQEYTLIINFILLVSTLLIFITCHLVQYEFITALYIYTIILTFLYLGFLILYYYTILTK